MIDLNGKKIIKTKEDEKETFDILNVTLDDDFKKIKVYIEKDKVETVLNLYIIIKNGIYIFEDSKVQKELENLVVQADEIEREKLEKKKLEEKKKKEEYERQQEELARKTNVKSLDKKYIKDDIVNSQKLEEKHYYGPVAKRIYELCIDKFGFNKDKIGKFGNQQDMYSNNVTKEGFSLWFLPNSNWSDAKSTNKNWTNNISEDLSKIEMIGTQLTNIDEKFKEEKRLVFAKRYGQYIFLGVYKTASYDKNALCMTFERISTVYPI